FQAEDGIRDRNVTGVQTCALPISEFRNEHLLGTVLGQALARSFTGDVLVLAEEGGHPVALVVAHSGIQAYGGDPLLGGAAGDGRSEERRVGEEGGAWRVAGV